MLGERPKELEVKGGWEGRGGQGGWDGRGGQEGDSGTNKRGCINGGAHTSTVYYTDPFLFLPKQFLKEPWLVRLNFVCRLGEEQTIHGIQYVHFVKSSCLKHLKEGVGVVGQTSIMCGKWSEVRKVHSEGKCTVQLQCVVLGVA